MKKKGKKKKKFVMNEDEVYAISLFIGIGLSLLIHGLALSKLNLHPTLHALIGIGLYTLIITISSILLKKIWNIKSF